MEILIIGGIIVALMIYSSTRIKRSAAAAFEEEAIETAEYALVKPAGFLSPVEPPDFLAFYAYSKEYGEQEAAEKVRQSQIKLKILAGRSLADIVKEEKKSFDKVITEEKAGDNALTLIGERAEKQVETIFYHKFAIAGEQIYDLEMSFLADYREKYQEKAEKLLASFHVK